MFQFEKPLCVTGFVAAAVSVASFASGDMVRPHHLADDTLIAWTSGSSAHGPEAATALSTGFESPFTVGPLNGQQGWTTFTSTGDNRAAAPVISTVNPAAGLQRLQIQESPSPTPLAALLGGFSPSLPQTPPDPVFVSVDVLHNSPQGADGRVVGQSNTQGFLSFDVLFDYRGNIWVRDDIDGPGPGGFTFVNTNTPYLPNAWAKLTVEFDPTGSGVKYFYNNNLFYTQITPLAGTVVEQVILASDNFWNNSSEVIAYDNLSITVIPEPASLSLLALGGLVLRRRRA